VQKFLRTPKNFPVPTPMLEWSALKELKQVQDIVMANLAK